MKAIAKKKLLSKVAVALSVVLVLFGVFFAVPAKAENAPGEVLEAYDGVVRIITLDGYGYMAIGSGFLVGTDKRSYVVTNHHVVEEALRIDVLYDTKKPIEATVLHDFPELDLCVLKLREKIPGGKVLPLQLDVFDSGMSIYALGFPYAADTVLMSYDDYLRGAGVLKSDKQSITLTNGMISAIRSSNSIGTGEQPVSVVQSNVSISAGNSGGPIIDKAGNVIGINTQISSMDTKIAVSVHVRELADMLDILEIEYKAVYAMPDVLAKQEKQEKDRNIMLIIIIGTAILLGVAAILLVITKNKKAGPAQRAISLDEFERTNQRLEAKMAYQFTKNFLHEVVMLSEKQEVHSLLSPENVCITSSGIVMEKKTIKGQTTKLEIYQGYSAPECYTGKTGEGTDVYFIGSMLYLLLTGQRPQDGLERAQRKEPLFGKEGDTLLEIVNAATEPVAENRVQKLNVLLQMFVQNAEKVADENSAGYGPSALDKLYI